MLYSDADLSTPIEELERLAAPVLHGKCRSPSVPGRLSARKSKSPNLHIASPWGR